MNNKTTFKQIIKLRDLAYLCDIGAEVGEYYPKNDIIEGKLYVTGSYHNYKKESTELFSETIPFSILIDNNSIEVHDIDCSSFESTVIEGRGIEITFDISITYEEKEDDIECRLDDEYVNFENESQNEHILESCDGIEYCEVKDLSCMEKTVDENEQDNSGEFLEEERKLFKNPFKTDVIHDENINNISEEQIECVEITKDEINGDLEQCDNEDEKQEEKNKLKNDTKNNEDEKLKINIEHRVDEVLKEKLLNVTDNYPQDEVTFRTLSNKYNTLKVFYYKSDKELEYIAEKTNQPLNKIFQMNRQTDFNKHRRIIIEDANGTKN